MLVVVLFATILVAAFAALSPPASAARAPASGMMSVVNKIPDFYAEGKGEPYSNMFMKISSKGGYLNTGTTTIQLTPWGYVTTDWSIGKVYIILLANVTESNFYIAYLYLTNSSSPMIIRLFEYKYATLRNFVIYGVQYVFTRYTTTLPVEMPTINFVPKAQPGNSISAIGPELYLNRKSGQVINGTSAWDAYPLFEQYFSDESEYNEIWTLFTDGLGGYYFGIFYVPNNDPNHVILEHQVRLNDLKPYTGRSFEASWTKKGFPYLLTVNIPVPGIVKVNGFPVESNSKGVASIYVPKAAITVEAPSEIDATVGTRWHFSSWGNLGTSNPLTLKVGSDLQLTANYNLEFMLTVDSEYGNVQGAGWYGQGANATISAPTVLPSDNSTQRVFLRWEGDYASESNPSVVSMNSPKHVIAIWKTQYDVKLQLIGVAADTTAQVTVNGDLVSISGSLPVHFWVDANTQLTIQVQSTQIPGTNVDYNFGELRVDGQPSGTNILVAKPLAIDLIYSSSSKSPSSIELAVSPESALQGQVLTITGKINAQHAPSTIKLYYSSDSKVWESLAEVSVNDGAFTYAWTPSSPGSYSIRAYWPGDENFGPSSQVVSVQVRQGYGAEPGSNDMPNLEIAIRRLNGVPGLMFVAALAGSLLALGAYLASFVPGAPLLTGYLIGGLLIGFVFIFPISALVLSLKAARSRRSPSRVWLIPLATVWVGALMLFVANRFLSFAPAGALDPIPLLVVASNAVFVPLALSLALARKVAA